MKIYQAHTLALLANAALVAVLFDRVLCVLALMECLQQSQALSIPSGHRPQSLLSCLPPNLPHLSTLTPMGLKLLWSFQFLRKLFSRKFLSNFSVLEILHFYISTYGMRVGKMEEGNGDKEWCYKVRMKPSKGVRKCSCHLLALTQSVTTQRLHGADFTRLFPLAPVKASAYCRDAR